MRRLYWDWSTPFCPYICRRYSCPSPNTDILKAAKDVRASHDALVELFERIESFFKRLGVYSQVSLTTEMAEVFVNIVVEVLSILSIATKEVQRKRASELLQDIHTNLLSSHLIRNIFQETAGTVRY
jgi:putative ubiquitin-RnfH superfamily antitoxin RatB of RatAB toxin-antitoxin module